MPVFASRDSSTRDLADCIEIGLVNNMPGKALESTERQFLRVLDAASQEIVVRLWLYSLPGDQRTYAGRRQLVYSSIDELWNRRLDAIIVTGMEPRAANLMHEPYWPHMTRLIDWAEQNTRSAIWSCLAAHAAVLRTDGIERRRLSQKRFGLFECDTTSGNELASGVASSVCMPHSRWNDVGEEDLKACGYTILTRSEDAGADAFFKPGKTLSLFFQGHPEYEAHTLQQEYLRDAARFLRRENDHYPSPPQRYFDPATEQALRAIEQRAISKRQPELLIEISQVCAAATKAHASWHLPAVRIYRNWLRMLASSMPRRHRSQGIPRYSEASA